MFDPLKPRTCQEPVIELPHHDLPEEPGPAEGCDVCNALDRRRTAARQVGDMSKVTDCNVELRRHPHLREKQREKR